MTGLINKRLFRWSKTDNSKYVSGIRSLPHTRQLLLMQSTRSLHNSKPTNNRISNLSKNSTSYNHNSKNSRKTETKSSARERNSKSMSLLMNKSFKSIRQTGHCKRPKLRPIKTNYKTSRFSFHKKSLKRKRPLLNTRNNAKPISKHSNSNSSISIRKSNSSSIKCKRLTFWVKPFYSKEHK